MDGCTYIHIYISVGLLHGNVLLLKIHVRTVDCIGI